jgi:hypothetical protein
MIQRGGHGCLLTMSAKGLNAPMLSYLPAGYHLLHGKKNWLESTWMTDDWKLIEARFQGDLGQAADCWSATVAFN